MLQIFSKPLFPRDSFNVLEPQHWTNIKSILRRIKPCHEGSSPFWFKNLLLKAPLRYLMDSNRAMKKHHSILFKDEALETAAKLSEKHISDRALPDKAVDLFDEAGAQKHLALINVATHIRELESEKNRLNLKQKEEFNQQKIFKL